MRHCPACGSSFASTVGVLNNTMEGLPGPQQYDLLTCNRCETIYLSPMISDEVVRVMYCERTQFDGGVYTESVKPILDYYIDTLTRIRCGGIDRFRILEVGAGLAWICRAAKMLDENSLTHAQDITSEAADCSWVDRYHVGPIADLHEYYNLISLTHVIEHLTEPVGVIKTLRERLQNGIILLTAPYRPKNWDGSIETWREWSYNHTPAHLTYFSKAGLQSLAAATGLSVVHHALEDDGQAFACWLKP